MKQPSNNCIFCGSAGPFTCVEHPIPESLGNDDMVLPPGYVCDKCNQYFGTKIEQVVLGSPPFSVERIAAAIKTKKGKYAKLVSPQVSLHSTGFWDQVVFYGSNHRYKKTFPEPEGGVLWVDCPVDQRIILGRFLLKIGLELPLFPNSDDP